MTRETSDPPSISERERQALLNTFASRCFRNVADMDYINARLCYRAGLATQSSWAALQAMEKYYKAILLYNRIKAKDVGHWLSQAQRHAKKLPFTIHLSPSSQSLIDYLNMFGQNRYLDLSYSTHGARLPDLDRAVWEIRRYCRPLDYSITTPGGKLDCLQLELDKILAAETTPPHKFTIAGGALEEVIRNKQHPARSALVWQNLFFGKSHRKEVKIRNWLRSENSPLWLYPELLDLVEDYVMIPRSVAEAYRNHFSTQPRK